MLPLPDFELLRPATLDDALRLLAQDGTMALAGGTDLLPNLRRGLAAPQRLVDLAALRGLDTLEARDRHWRLGAGVTLATLARDAALGQALPALAQAAGEVAGPGHRSIATLGGNLCLDTRCVFYNQSEWWRAANNHCLKRGSEVCHVAPKGHRCTPPSAAIWPLFCSPWAPRLSWSQASACAACRCASSTATTAPRT